MLRFRDCSISRKLTWMNMLVSGIALGLACAVFIAFDLISFRRTMDRNLSIQAQIVGSNSVSALLFDDRNAAEKTLSALAAAPNIVCGGIYTPEGQPFAAYWRDHRSQAAPLPPIHTAQIQVDWLKNRQMVVVQPIMFQGKLTGTVYIRSDLQEWIDRLKRYVMIVSAVLLLSLLAALLTSSICRRAIADPIVSLAETARLVSREKIYSVRAPATGNRDELAVLIGTFNEMLAQIQEGDGALRSEIAGRKHAQEEIRQLNDELELRVQQRTAELEAANKELEAFTYSVSHDLRAPLRHISGFTRILVEEFGPSLPEGAQHHLQRIEHGARRMGLLVDDLLNLTRVGRQSLSVQVTGLGSLVKDVLSLLEPEAAGRKVEWRIADLPFVECDPNLIRQVLQNLMGNALKYSRPRSPAVIEIGQIEKDGQPVIFVKDNGVGFSMKYADKLFGVFQRLHRPEDFEGTGVGLATVSRIIQKHGGRVWAEAELDKGATFYFTLGGCAQAATQNVAATAGGRS